MNQANCINIACNMTETCSHALIYKQKDGSDETLVVINPKAMEFDADGRCQHYCEPQTIKVAHGFLKMCNKIPNQMYREFCSIMSGVYNHTDFYCMRSGKLPIYPERQEKIISILTKLGYEIPDNPWDEVTEEVKYF